MRSNLKITIQNWEDDCIYYLHSCITPENPLAWFRHTLPCVHDTDYISIGSLFKLHVYVVHDEKRNAIEFGSCDPRSTLALYV